MKNKTRFVKVEMEFDSGLEYFHVYGDASDIDPKDIVLFYDQTGHGVHMVRSDLLNKPHYSKDNNI